VLFPETFTLLIIAELLEAAVRQFCLNQQGHSIQVIALLQLLLIVTHPVLTGGIPQ
jgi:hypothetical protein